MLTKTHRSQIAQTKRQNKDVVTITALIALMFGAAMLAIGVVSLDDSGDPYAFGGVRRMLLQITSKLFPMSALKYQAQPKRGRLTINGMYMARDGFENEFDLTTSEEAMEFAFKELPGENAGKFAILCSDGEWLRYVCGENNDEQIAWPMKQIEGTFEVDASKLCGDAICTMMCGKLSSAFKFGGAIETVEAVIEEDEEEDVNEARRLAVDAQVETDQATSDVSYLKTASDMSDTDVSSAISETEVALAVSGEYVPLTAQAAVVESAMSGEDVAETMSDAEVALAVSGEDVAKAMSDAEATLADEDVAKVMSDAEDVAKAMSDAEDVELALSNAEVALAMSDLDEAKDMSDADEASPISSADIDSSGTNEPVRGWTQEDLKLLARNV